MSKRTGKGGLVGGWAWEVEPLTYSRFCDKPGWRWVVGREKDRDNLTQLHRAGGVCGTKRGAIKWADRIAYMLDQGELPT